MGEFYGGLLGMVVSKRNQHLTVPTDHFMPVQRYIRYTAEELAAQEEARKKQEAKDELPETVAALNAALADADALNLDQDYRMTLLELGVTDDETTA